MIIVVGAGLAGCEAAWTAAEHGSRVLLIEQKPIRYSPAHKSEKFAELVCSNSFKARRANSAAGLLKEEMRALGSLTVECAYRTEVPAGGALAVDREKFSDLVTEKIRSHPLIEIRSCEVIDIPHNDGPVIIATGPLTDGALAEDISRLTGGYLHFHDAASPIVTFASVDMSKAFFASRYGKGGDDYINCPFNKEQYEAFHEALIHAQSVELHEFEKSDRDDFKVYEGCMPVEVLAKRGADAVRYGTMKPVGLTDPNTGHRPWAAVQLRKENEQGTLYNLVGFQTNLKFGEQKRVFSMIPGLENADFVRYGVMHRNSFINSPQLLFPDFSLRQDRNIFFAGQITGVEGYMESAASGIIAGLNAAGIKTVLPEYTMIGALSHYISDPDVKDFQPMGANMGILPPLETEIRDKQMRYQAIADRSLAYFRNH
ncbi:MAG: methylenetetrahydrofolate--tRNA-(uracil(54)-C(5))-methyltransferase (FADH(2)-oxidizing) TrmFO [Oscillospiraceae bacterium]|nr:methylenetetrahydrofolate--tRNA-(uracil(54)-C(5))-methyltransferase (FADH(2)-oxidizing) TrmFO [Oscillospiraceae bacterium]